MKKVLLVFTLIGCLLLGGHGSTVFATISPTTDVLENTKIENPATVSSVENADEEPDESALTKTFLDDQAEISEKNLADNDWSTFLNLAEYKGLTLRYPEEAAAKKGDKVNINFVGTIDGVPFDGGSGDEILVLGSNTFFESFEEQLIGHKKGEIVDVVIIYPEDYYNKELRGKKAHFAVTINYIEKMNPTEAFVYVVNKSKIKNYPMDLYNEMLYIFREAFTKLSEEYNIPYEELVHTFGYEEDVRTREDAKAWLVSKAILQQEGITCNNALYQETEASILTSKGYNSRQEAIDGGVLEGYIDYQVEIKVATNLINLLSAGYVAPPVTPTPTEIPGAPTATPTPTVTRIPTPTSTPIQPTLEVLDIVTTVDVSKPQTLAVEVLYRGNGKLTYTSNNSKIKVDANGMITIPKNYAGSAIITVQASATRRYTAAEAKMKVTVRRLENMLSAKAVTKVSSANVQSFKLEVRQEGTGKLTYKSNSPSVRVTNAGKVTIARNFSGRATITIKAAASGAYSAAKQNLVITVKPAAVTAGTAKNIAGQKIALAWKRPAGAEGYQIKYATSKNFKNAKSINVKSASTIKGNLTKLTKGKTYYIRIRAYKKDVNGNLFSAWKTFKAVKVTK